MVALEQGVVDKVVAALPSPVQRVLRVSGLFLAGGFVRSVVEGEKPKDIDIFGPTHQDLERYSELLAGSRGRLKTNNAISVQLSKPPIQVQFILRWLFSRPEDVIRSFDFTIAQAVVWFDRSAGVYGEWKGMCAPTFINDVENQQLVYTSPTREEDAAGSLLRVNRFLGRGYKISDDNLGLVVARITERVIEIKDAKSDVPLMDGFSIKRFDVVEDTKAVIRGARPSGGGSV